jgi:hypothetical protein
MLCVLDFGEKKRTSGPYGSEGIAGGPIKITPGLATEYLRFASLFLFTGTHVPRPAVVSGVPRPVYLV